MDKVKLEAKSREERGRKVNKGRREGLVPSVIYGHGVPSKSLWVVALDLKRLLRKSGESTIIDLQIDGKDDRNVLIHEIQRHGISNQFTHIDFFQVNMAEKIETEVELVFIGESKAVKEMGGILVKNIDKVTVKCLPADLPSHIDVDISLIDSFEKHLTIGDLKVSAKVELEIDPETVVALVTPARTEAELAELEEKVDADVTKVEGVVKPEAPAEEKPKEKK
jgi:large subunit ribosomal protein L25